jgi:putative lipoprotein
LAFLAALAATFPAASQTDLTGSHWLAEDIMGGGVVDRAQSTLQPLPDGRVAGSSGCNRFNGSGVISGGKVAIGALATTRMACPPAIMDQEQKFLAALGKAARYETTSSGALILRDSRGAALMRFTRM